MALPKTFGLKTANGEIDVPSVGFGTWAFGDTGWCYEATRDALKAGYRHLDCAWNYGTDSQVGSAIRDSGIPRNELFITTKFWPHWGAPENVEKCLDACLGNMQLDYIDLYLAHWPLVLKAASDICNAKATPTATNEERGIATGSDGRAFIDWQYTCKSIAAAHQQTGSFNSTWKAMQALVTKGKVRAIGVSNFNIEQIQEVLADGGSIPLSCNQVEAHPWFPNTELLEFMDEYQILKVTYCPFAGQKADGVPLVNDPHIQELAKKNNMGVGQLLISWAVQRGTIPVGKSQTPERIIENLEIRRISQEDFAVLNNMSRGESGRTVDLGAEWGVKFY